MGLWDSWLTVVGGISMLFLIIHLNTPGWLDQQIADAKQYAAQARYARGYYY